MLWASRALAVTDSAVDVPASDRERSTSAASDLTWLAASEDAVTSVDLGFAGAGENRRGGGVPAAVSVRSTSSASNLICEAASEEVDISVVWASRALLRIEFAAPVPTEVREASTSAEVSRNWAPTSDETVSRACCAVRAPVWMVSVVLTTRFVSERSASSTWERMPSRAVLGARHEVVAGLAAAAFDTAGNGFDARAEQILELRDAHVDVAGNRADPGFDTLMDILEPRRDGVGQMGAAAVDGLGDVGDAAGRRLSIACAVPTVSDVVRLVRRESIDWIAWAVPPVSDEVSSVSRESIEWIACAAPSVNDVASVPRRLSIVSVTDLARVSKRLFQRFQAAIDGLVERLDLGVERLVEVVDARAERGFELQQALIERGGDLAAIRGQAGVEGVDIVLQLSWMSWVRWPMRSTISPPKVLTVRSNSEMWRVISAPSVPESRANFSASSRALVPHQFVERAHLQARGCRARFRSG